MREEIAAALKNALKSGDKRRVSTLRMAQAAIQERDIQHRGAGKGPADAADVTAILGKLVKTREESARAFADGGRPELAEGEREEIAVLREFLPQQMGAAEAEAAVRAAVAETGAASPRDMGRVMALLKERHAGRLDMGAASALLKTLLR